MRRLHAPLRNRARGRPSAVEVIMADDNVIYPVTRNEDLVAAGLPTEDDDNIRKDVAALLGVDLPR
jgi:hypothetical protein